MSSKDLENSKDQNPEDEMIKLETTSKDFIHSVEMKATEDNINIKRLVFWGVLGVVVIIISVITCFYVFRYSKYEINKQIQGNSENYQITELRKKDDQILDSYGIINKEKGIYHIPIDSAMAIYVRENQQSK